MPPVPGLITMPAAHGQFNDRIVLVGVPTGTESMRLALVAAPIDAASLIEPADIGAVTMTTVNSVPGDALTTVVALIFSIAFVAMAGGASPKFPMIRRTTRKALDLCRG